ncbi:MAG: tetratricopeptide repeat protein [Candidatus Latescibacteria bacterium]|nr:tetratricopeptide repeat protein [Candidatus Latescibacterota bacterium]
MRSVKTTRRPSLPATFAVLNALHPLRPIRDAVDYDNAVEVLDRLAVLDRRTAYQEAIRRDFRDPRVYANLGAALRGLGRLPEAEQAYHQAIELHSDNIETYLGLSQLYQENGQLDEVLRVYSQILGMDLPGGTSELYTKIGTALFYLGKLDESTTAYRKALAKDANKLDPEADGETT